ncbi:MAG: DUF4058 family protein [Isosphaeraceae bacterium]
MASRFPGVDPYIEAQDFWQDFHSRFLTYACDAINEKLPSGYVAQLGKKPRLTEAPARRGRAALPDVPVLGARRKADGARAAGRSSSATAILEPVRLPLPVDYVEVRDTWIEVHRGRRRQIVASIEVLSPTNKTGTGRAEYLAKRRDLIQRRIHLVELDLLLRGTRLPMARPLPAGDFYALVSRAEERPQSDVYAWGLRDPIPPVPIPLSPPDGDVILDLAEVFGMAYERGRYADLVDYDVPPATVKNPSDRTWAQRTARARRR